MEEKILQLFRSYINKEITAARLHNIFMSEILPPRLNRDSEWGKSCYEERLPEVDMVWGYLNNYYIYTDFPQMGEEHIQDFCLQWLGER